MNPNFPTLDPVTWLLVVIVAIALVTLKGFALYRAGVNKDKVWFAMIFVLNTLGILELVYLLGISKNKK